MARAESFTLDGACPSAQLIDESALALLAAVRLQRCSPVATPLSFHEKGPIRGPGFCAAARGLTHECFGPSAGLRYSREPFVLAPQALAMSIEMYVFFRGKLPSKAALTRAMKELGFPFTIKPATGSLDKQHGYMPMLLRRDETGVEFDVYDDPSALAEFADVGFDPSFNRMANFRWAGDPQEMVAGMCCAAALAKLVGGVVFDAEAAKLHSADEAIAFAQSNLDLVAEPKGARVPGTRPADIKRYLKPLLKLRSDLVLVGRHLLIRPVRHLLRGALLDRTGDKYSFEICHFDRPLYEPFGFVGPHSIHPVRWKVYEPYFKTLLLDSLKEDIFDEVGKLTSVAEVKVMEPFVALVLWGQLDEAAELLNEYERRWASNPDSVRRIEKQRGVLASGIPALCEEYHAKERATAEAMKLGDAWEPSPFPVEVTGSDRARVGSESVFFTTPWAELPANLWREMPDVPGDICFATFILERKGRQILWMPLTEQEAKERHQGYQEYVLAARLPDGMLVCLKHRTAWSPHDPVQPLNPAYVPTRDFHLHIHGSNFRITASIDEDREEKGSVDLYSVSVYEGNATSDKWHAFNYFREQTVSIHDSRAGVPLFNKRAMTPSDISLCRFTLPMFGDFWTYFMRVRDYLKREGLENFV